MLNEIEASQLSDIEFKAMVIRKLNDLTENYQKLQGNYEELIANYIHEKEIETINKSLIFFPPFLKSGYIGEIPQLTLYISKGSPISELRRSRRRHH